MMISTEPIIFVCGFHATGKTELSKHVCDEYNLGFVETGEMVRSVYVNRPRGLELLDIYEYVKVTEESEPGYFTRLLCNEITNLFGRDGINGVIVNGMRTLRDLENTSKHFDSNPSYIVWVSTANREVLLERYLRRENCKMGLEEFESLLEGDKGLGLGEIKTKQTF